MIPYNKFVTKDINVDEPMNDVEQWFFFVKVKSPKGNTKSFFKHNFNISQK
jgi:hypothetical protein